MASTTVSFMVHLGKINRGERRMDGRITLTVDGIQVSVPEGATLLEAAQQAQRAVPTLCYHPHLTANGLCRLCVVEVEGARLLQPACVAKAQEGMVVYTRSPRVDRARRTILLLLASATDVSEDANLQALLREYDVDPQVLGEVETRAYPLIDDNPMYVRDYAKCVLCWRCVQICAEDAQYTFAITLAGRGFHTRIDTFYHISMPESTCVFCGQCVEVCPTGALKPRREYLLEHGYQPEDLVHVAAFDVAPVHRPATAFASGQGQASE